MARSMSTVLTALRELPTSQWSRRDPATAKEIDAIEAEYGLQLPADYRELLRATNGCGIYPPKGTKLDLDSADDVLCNNTGDPRFEGDLPGMFIIGSDNSGGVVYYDPANRLGKGAWALFLVDLGTIGFPYSKPVAPSLTALIERVLAGETLWNDRVLGSRRSRPS